MLLIKKLSSCLQGLGVLGVGLAWASMASAQTPAPNAASPQSQGAYMNLSDSTPSVVSMDVNSYTEPPVVLGSSEVYSSTDSPDEPWTLFGRRRENTRLNIGGWASMGYHSDSNGLFNSQPDGFNLHQGWLFVEKKAESNNGELALGFRFDGMYGIDANDTQAFGNPGATWDLDPRFTRGGGYGWALPQLYGEVAMGDLSVKVGHFFTLVGYEVVTAPDNFFYSHAMTMYNSEPFTHTGALATWEASDDLSLFGGWTAGWDSGFDFSAGSNFIGGFTKQLNDSSSLTYITTFGNFGARGNDAYSHSFVLQTTVTERLTSVLQSDLVRVGSTGEDNVGLNHYLFYQINDRVSIGKRSEWWKGDNVTGYAPFGGVLPAGGSHSHYAQTVGLNIKAGTNLTIRPEFRYNFSPAVDYEEGVFGIDFIATF